MSDGLLERGLRGDVVIRENVPALLDLLLQRVTTLAAAASAERGSFHVALSGGGTPKPLYERWAASRSFPWDATHIWLVDERQVPRADERSNWRMIRAALCHRVPIPPDQLHPMPTARRRGSDDVGAQYSAEIDGAFASSPPRFDFVLLGMGADGHTASLFPDSPALDVSDAWAATNDGERVVPPPRVTLTYPTLNAAQEIAVLAIGASKTDTLRRVAQGCLDGEADRRELPICGIDPAAHGGRLVWYLDKAAAAKKKEL